MGLVYLLLHKINVDMIPLVSVAFTTERLNFGSAPKFRTRSSPFFICIFTDLFFRKIPRSTVQMLEDAGKYIAALQRRLYLPENSCQLLNLQLDAIWFHFWQRSLRLGQLIS